MQLKEYHLLMQGGLLWFKIQENQVRLTPARLAEIEQASAEQKENRRHTGDSPFPR